jgi:hypothetical protein
LKGNPNFEYLFSIMKSKDFLSMEGLGNEVPFFVHAYEPVVQGKVYEGIHNLKKRLETEGVEPLLIGLYDMVIEHMQENKELEDTFDYEKSVPKTEFFKELVNTYNADGVVKPYFKKKINEQNYNLVILYQVGEVFPFLRTHNVLNWLQSIIKDIPLVVFFPGEYITAPDKGFKLNLFGKFSGPYYRAFRLEDYALRGVSHD